jgi:hypothetical protein
LGFIPTGGSGRFNVDVKSVNIGIVATLSASKPDPDPKGLGIMLVRALEIMKFV